MADWKNLLKSLSLTLLGMFLLLCQYKYQWVNWANQWSARIFVLLLIGLIAIGQSYLKKNFADRIKFGLLSFGLQFIGLLAIGGFGITQNALNGVDFVGSSGYWIAFDTLSTPFTSKALEFKIIVETITKTIPSMMLLVGVIGVWTADSPDEQQSSLIETGITLGILILFGFFGNLIGFTLF